MIASAYGLTSRLYRFTEGTQIQEDNTNTNQKLKIKKLKKARFEMSLMTGIVRTYHAMPKNVRIDIHKILPTKILLNSIL